MTSSRKDEKGLASSDAGALLDALDEMHDVEIVAPPPPSSRSLSAATAVAAGSGTWDASAAPVREGHGSYRGSLPGELPRSSDSSKAETIADSLSVHPVQWIEQLWSTADEARFSERAPLVEPAVRILAERGATRVLWPIECALYRAAGEGGHRHAGARAAMANKMLRVFGDPQVLRVVARHVLAEGEQAAEEGQRVLLQAGAAGAYGLYGARLDAAGSSASIPSAANAGSRAVFVRVMSAFGVKAWPVVKAALEKVHRNIADPRARAVAEDLLLSVPATAPHGDDTVGHLVMRFVRVDAAAVNKAATLAVIRVWGERARPLLFGLLGTKQDSVRLAALAGLKQVGSIDEHVVPHLSAMLFGRVPAGDDLRVGAAVALGHVGGRGRSPAISLLEQIVLSAPGGARPADALVLAAANALANLRAPDVRAVIAKRLEQSGEPLRARLEELLFRL